MSAVWFWKFRYHVTSCAFHISLVALGFLLTQPQVDLPEGNSLLEFELLSGQPSGTLPSKNSVRSQSVQSMVPLLPQEDPSNGQIDAADPTVPRVQVAPASAMESDPALKSKDQLSSGPEVALAKGVEGGPSVFGVAGGNAQMSIREKYLRALQAYLSSRKKYPSLAKRMREEGLVIIEFSVAKDGSFFDERIIEPSRSPRLNNAAIELVQELGRFRAFPEEILQKESELIVRVPIQYQLTEPM